MTSHRYTYYQQNRRLERVETARYADTDGNQIVVASCHASLKVGQWPVACTKDYNIHRAVDVDSQECYVVKLDHMGGLLKWAGQRSTGGTREDTYCPADEWSLCGDHVYATIEDAKIHAGDAAMVAAEHARLNEMLAAATRAAKQVDGDETRWSRAGYEAACAAAGLPTGDDAEVEQITGQGGGVYAIPEYHCEHVAWIRLASRRAAGIEAEAAAAAASAMQCADTAAGTGHYARDQYEIACAAAGVSPLSDEAIPGVIGVYHCGPYESVRDVLGEVAAHRALGALPEVAASLASRRAAGMHNERAVQRRCEREALTTAGRSFATSDQVNTIMRLLAQRGRSGEGGGFFSGPTDRAGVENLSVEDADTYIVSLRGDY